MLFRRHVGRVGRSCDNHSIVWAGVGENLQMQVAESASTLPRQASATVGECEDSVSGNRHPAIGGFPSVCQEPVCPSTVCSPVATPRTKPPPPQPESTNKPFRVPPRESRNGKNFEQEWSPSSKSRHTNRGLLLLSTPTPAFMQFVSPHAASNEVCFEGARFAVRFAKRIRCSVGNR